MGERQIGLSWGMVEPSTVDEGESMTHIIPTLVIVDGKPEPEHLVVMQALAAVVSGPVGKGVGGRKSRPPRHR
jgi:hypothetical protein